MCTERKLHSNWRSPADTPSLSPTVVVGLRVRYSRHRSSSETFFFFRKICSWTDLFVMRGVGEPIGSTVSLIHLINQPSKTLHLRNILNCLYYTAYVVGSFVKRFNYATLSSRSFHTHQCCILSCITGIFTVTQNGLFPKFHKFNISLLALFFLWLCSPARAMASSYNEVSWSHKTTRHSR
jgi:hypothetical protein